MQAVKGGADAGGAGGGCWEGGGSLPQQEQQYGEYTPQYLKMPENLKADESKSCKITSCKISIIQHRSNLGGGSCWGKDQLALLGGQGLRFWHGNFFFFFRFLKLFVLCGICFNAR